MISINILNIFYYIYMDGKQEQTHRTQMPHRTILNVNLNLEFNYMYLYSFL